MILTEKNFELYAAKNYKNLLCEDTSEFLEDLNRIKYLKKLLKSYSTKNEINFNLVLNHIIILYNVFDAKACTKMLFLRLDTHWPVLKSFLYYLGYLENYIKDIGLENNIIDTSTIPFDAYIFNKMKEIYKC
jgi:hypothetical protein